MIQKTPEDEGFLDHKGTFPSCAEYLVLYSWSGLCAVVAQISQERTCVSVDQFEAFEGKRLPCSASQTSNSWSQRQVPVKLAGPSLRPQVYPSSENTSPGLLSSSFHRLGIPPSAIC